MAAHHAASGGRWCKAADGLMPLLLPGHGGCQACASFCVAATPDAAAAAAAFLYTCSGWPSFMAWGWCVVESCWCELCVCVMHQATQQARLLLSNRRRRHRRLQHS